MRVVILAFLLSFILKESRAQCDLGTTGIAIVDASNTGPVLSGCVGTVYNFKFTIANFGQSCTLPANTVTASFVFPTISGGIKPYIYNGPASFVSGYFTWNYDAFNEQLTATNTTAIPAGSGDVNILVQVIGNEVGTASSPLNLSSGPNSNSSLANDNSSAQLTINASPTVSNQPDQSKCNNGSFTMTQTGTGTWTLVSGTATISTPASPTTTITGVPVGTAATLRWTVSNGTCTVYDDVAVTNNAVPTASVNSIVNNTCHAGSNGSISLATGPGYSYTIAGPTVNTTGQSSGIFTGLTAGSYTITVTAAGGCTNSTNANVTEPPGILPDISLGSDYDSNFFTTIGDESNIVFNIAEIAGNPATGDTVRIIRIPGYTFTYNTALTTIVIGSTTYTLDNSHWKIDDSNPSFASLIYDPAHNSTAGTLNCRSRLYITLKLKRNTLNISTFALSARLRKANTEVGLLNNLNTILFSAE